MVTEGDEIVIVVFIVIIVTLYARYGDYMVVIWLTCMRICIAIKEVIIHHYGDCY